MTDSFENHVRSLTSPPENGAAISPSDSADLPFVSRALYVGSGGDLAVRLQDGTDLVLANLAPGTLMPIRVARVRATGTTAGQVLAFW
jgi:hypothetical protein